MIFLENEMMYGVTMSAPDYIMDKDFVLPLNKAKIERVGTDVTITAFSKMVGFSLEAAAILEKEHGISCEVINLRIIRPLDRNTIVESVKKTSRIVNVEEGWPQSGIGAEISALMMESAFDYLDAPLERIAGADVPMPYSHSIEQLAVPQVHNIVKGVLRACHGKKQH